MQVGRVGRLRPIDEYGSICSPLRVVFVIGLHLYRDVCIVKTEVGDDLWGRSGTGCSQILRIVYQLAKFTAIPRRTGRGADLVTQSILLLLRARYNGRMPALLRIHRWCIFRLPLEVCVRRSYIN